MRWTIYRIPQAFRLLKSKLRKFWYSDVNGIQMFYIQAPTVQQMIILQPACTYTSFQFSIYYQCYINLLFHERFLIAILFFNPKFLSAACAPNPYQNVRVGEGEAYLNRFKIIHSFITLSCVNMSRNSQAQFNPG